eukprot:3938495-Rhodomonas_salina.1
MKGASQTNIPAAQTSKQPRSIMGARHTHPRPWRSAAAAWADSVDEFCDESTASSALSNDACSAKVKLVAGSCVSAETLASERATEDRSACSAAALARVERSQRTAPRAARRQAPPTPPPSAATSGMLEAPPSSASSGPSSAGLECARPGSPTSMESDTEIGVTEVMAGRAEKAARSKDCWGPELAAAKTTAISTPAVPPPTPRCGWR